MPRRLGLQLERRMERLGYNYRIVRYGEYATFETNPYVKHDGIQAKTEWNIDPFSANEYFDTWKINVTKEGLELAFAAALAINPLAPGLTIAEATTGITQVGGSQLWYVSEDNGTTFIPLRVVDCATTTYRYRMTLVATGIGQNVL